MPPDNEEPARRFDALFEELSPDIIAYCRWRAQTRSDAQDAVAEVFLVAWRRLSEVPNGDAARVWLYATARRVIANQRRSDARRAQLRKRLDALPVTLSASEETPNPTTELVHAALRRLKPSDQEVLLLTEWEGLSPSEVATVMDCSSVTARGRLHRARRRFKRAFEELEATSGGIDRGGPAERTSPRRDHPPMTTVRVARPAEDDER